MSELWWYIVETYVQSRYNIHMINAEGGILMATSSITKNFVVTGQEQVNKFANAIEESFLDSQSKQDVPASRATYLEGDKLKEFLQKRKQNNGG